MLTGELSRVNDFHIACFLSAARIRNFSAAAKEFSVPQQVVSRNIKQLENELSAKKNDDISDSELDDLAEGLVPDDKPEEAKPEAKPEVKSSNDASDAEVDDLLKDLEL